MSVNEQEKRELNLLGAKVTGLPIIPVDDYRGGDYPGGCYTVWSNGNIDRCPGSMAWNPCEDLNQAWEVAEAFRVANPGTAFYLCSERQKRPEWPKLEAYASLSNLNDEDDEDDPGPPSADGSGPKAVALALMRQVQKAALTVSQAHRERA